MRLEFKMLPCVTGVRGGCFPAEKSADFVPWNPRLTHLLKGEIRLLGGFLLHLKSLLPYPVCQGLFSTQISCPPAGRADILAPAACSTFQRSLWEWLRGFAAVYIRGEPGSPAGVGMVGLQSRAVSLWPQHWPLCLEGMGGEWTSPLSVSSSFFVLM